MPRPVDPLAELPELGWGSVGKFGGNRVRARWLGLGDASAGALRGVVVGLSWGLGSVGVRWLCQKGVKKDFSPNGESLHCTLLLEHPFPQKASKLPPPSKCHKTISRRSPCYKRKSKCPK